MNLIPLNPTPGYSTAGSPPSRVAAFRNQLTELGVNATIRANRGTDIDAACGQLLAERSGVVPVELRVEQEAERDAEPMWNRSG